MIRFIRDPQPPYTAYKQGMVREIGSSLEAIFISSGDAVAAAAPFGVYPPPAVFAPEGTVPANPATPTLTAAQTAALSGAFYSRQNQSMRDLAAHNLRLAEPLLQLDLPSPYSATYAPGNKEHAYLHPVFFPAGWNGYRYWAVGAPYPTTYTDTATLTISSPCVLSVAGTLPSVGAVIYFTTTGALPTGLVASQNYYLLSGGQISATPGGTAINTSGTQSGVQTLRLYAPKYENPTIYVSNDGEAWVQPPNIPTNPISNLLTAAGNDLNSYNADPYIVAAPDGSKLYVLWCWFNRTGAIASCIQMSESADGLNWTAPVTVLSSASAAFIPNSPSMFWNGSGWTMMAVDTASGIGQIITTRTASSTPYAGWTAPSTVYSGSWSAVTATHPQARLWWHGLFVSLSESAVAGLLVDNGSGGGTAFSAKSADGGLTFSIQPFSFQQATAGGTWYRPGLLLSTDGPVREIRLYTSRIGPIQKQLSGGGFWMQTARLTEDFSSDAITRQMLRDTVHRSLVAPVALRNIGLLAWDSFNRTDSATTLGTAESGQTWTYNSANVFGISTNRAYITSTANSHAVIDVLATDYDVEVQLQTLGSQYFLLAGYADSSNFYRFGHNGSVPFFQKIVGGASVFLATVGTVALTAGDILRINKRGSRYQMLINDRPLDSYQDTAFATATKVGFQAAGASATYFENFIVRAG